MAEVAAVLVFFAVFGAVFEAGPVVVKAAVEHSGPKVFFAGEVS